MTPAEIDQLQQMGALSPETAGALLHRQQPAQGFGPVPQTMELPAAPNPKNTLDEEKKKIRDAVVGRAESWSDPNDLSRLIDSTRGQISGTSPTHETEGYAVAYKSPPPRPDLSQLVQPAPQPPVHSVPGVPNFAGLAAGAATAGRGFESELKTTQANYGSAIDKKSEAQTTAAQAEIDKNEAARKEMQRIVSMRNYGEALDENERQAEKMSVEGAAHELRVLEKDAAAYKIDPERKMRPLGAKILASLAMGLGQYAATLGHTENAAAKIIRSSIDDDIAAQQQELENKRLAARGKASELAEMKQRFGDADSARMALASKKWAYAIEELKSNLTKYDDPILKARAQEAIAQAELEKAANDEQFVMHRANLDAQNRSLRLQAMAQQADLLGKQKPLEPPPPGLDVIPGQKPSDIAVKKAQEIKGNVDSMRAQIASIRDLVFGENGVGREVFPTDVAKKAQNLAANLQLAVKEAGELGTLDRGAEVYMQRLVPTDPTQMNQGAVKAALDGLEESLNKSSGARLHALGFRPSIQERPPVPVQ